MVPHSGRSLMPWGSGLRSTVLEDVHSLSTAQERTQEMKEQPGEKKHETELGTHSR